MNRKRLIFLVILLISSSVFISPANSQKTEDKGASLILYPQSGAFVEGSTFEVSIYLNTGGNYVDVVEVDLKFDPEIFQVITPTKEFSIVSFWTSPPSFSNTEGIVALRGRFQDRGINVSEGLVSIVVFRAKSIGETTIKFLDSSKIILVGEKPANILNSVNIGTYDIFPAPPGGPQIFSNTHPDQNKWYKNNSPVFIWKKGIKTEGFSYKLDNSPFGEPDNIIDTTSDSYVFEGIQSGTWYFHLKAREREGWGGVSHFKVNIDNISPASFKPRPETFGATLDNYLLIHFDAIDLLSGIDHYEVRIEDRSNPKNILYSGFVQADSPYRLNVEKKGIFKVIIRAFDKAGNYQEEEIIIKALGRGLAIVSGGILLKGIFLSWRLVGLFLIFILLLGIGIVFWRIKRRANIQSRLEKDVKEVEEGLEDIKKLEEEIKEKPTARQQLSRVWEKLGNKFRNKNHNGNE